MTVPSGPRPRLNFGIRTGLAALVAIAVTLTGLVVLARSRSFQLFGRLVSRVETSQPLVALTFDDGPAASMVDEILATLDEAQVHATFFVTGSELASHPSAGRRIVERGHELANHSYTHQRMVLKPPAFIREEIERTDTVIRGAGQRGTIAFRPPYGYKLIGLPWFLWKTGRTTVMWDLEPDSYPEVAATASGIAAHVVERARPGSIILLHVWYPTRATSRAAVPLVVEGLRARGYRFLTVGELLRN